MFADKKQFVVVYDNDCKEYADSLMTLVSNDKTLRVIKRSRKEFDKDSSIVSDEYDLTIGEKASAHNRPNFGDIYNEFWVHIGFYGTKAWISCDFEFMDKNTRDDFFVKYNSLREEFVKEKYNHKNALKTIFIREAVLNLLIPPTPLLQQIARGIIFKNRLKELQYRYAIVLFYRDYLNDFLKTKEENNEEQNEEQNF